MAGLNFYFNSNNLIIKIIRERKYLKIILFAAESSITNTWRSHGCQTAWRLLLFLLFWRLNNWQVIGTQKSVIFSKPPNPRSFKMNKINLFRLSLDPWREMDNNFRTHSRKQASKHLPCWLLVVVALTTIYNGKWEMVVILSTKLHDSAWPVGSGHLQFLTSTSNSKVIAFVFTSSHPMLKIISNTTAANFSLEITAACELWNSVGAVHHLRVRGLGQHLKYFYILKILPQNVIRAAAQLVEWRARLEHAAVDFIVSPIWHHQISNVTIINRQNHKLSSFARKKKETFPFCLTLVNWNDVRQRIHALYSSHV